MSRYRARPVEVEAVQWSGSNWHQMLAWVTSVPDSMTFVDHGLLVVTQGDAKWELAQGTWLIRQPWGVWDLLDADFFDAVYEPAS